MDDTTEAIAGGGPAAPRISPLLRQTDLVRCLDADSLAWLLASSALRSCNKGEILYTPEDHGEVLFMLKRGCVYTYCLSGSGRKLVLGEYNAGTLFGLLALVGDGRYGVFAEAMEPSLLCLLPTAALRRLGQREPRLAWRLFEAVGESLRRAVTEGEKLAFRSLRARLASTLVALTEQHGLHLTGLTHQDLADRVGTYRETVTALLNELQRAGAIALATHHLQILDVEMLRDLAENDEGAPQRLGTPRSTPHRRHPLDRHTG
jgi:CRP-like cAMP-binding protein